MYLDVGAEGISLEVAFSVLVKLDLVVIRLWVFENEAALLHEVDKLLFCHVLGQLRDVHFRVVSIVGLEPLWRQHQEADMRTCQARVKLISLVPMKWNIVQKHCILMGAKSTGLVMYPKNERQSE